VSGAYYNEIDLNAAQWLRNLIAAGHIADGVIDTRSIEDVQPDDLRGFTQCHFFAGIGVWSYALRRAGWTDDRPVWTGSCPCQPFSAAGAGDGFADERHLWPAFCHLIAECNPSVVFGEQVASKAVDPWVDLVHADLEALGYAFGCIAFPSASVGAPHIRDRLYWVADSIGKGLEKRKSDERVQCEKVGPYAGEAFKCRGNASGVEITEDYWRCFDLLAHRDGKWRPVEPGTFPMAHGIASRVGRLRAYGNAINAEAARIFIGSFMEVEMGHDLV